MNQDHGLGNSKLSLATATEDDVVIGKTFYAGNRELKTGSRAYQLRRINIKTIDAGGTSATIQLSYYEEDECLDTATFLYTDNMYPNYFSFHNTYVTYHGAPVEDPFPYRSQWEITAATESFYRGSNGERIDPGDIGVHFYYSASVNQWIFFPTN